MPRKRDEKERTVLIKATLEDDGVEVGIPPQSVAEALMRDDHAGEQRSAGGLSVEIIDDSVDEPRNIGKEDCPFATAGRAEIEPLQEKGRK